MKTAVWTVGIIAAVLVVAIAYRTWRLTDFHFRVFGATVTIEGTPSRASSFYRNSWRQLGVVVLTNSGRQRVYAVNFGPLHDRRWRVLPCADFGYTVLPWVALSEQHGWMQACFAPNVTSLDHAGKVVQMSGTVQRNPVIGPRLLEFTHDDGKRVKVEW